MFLDKFCTCYAHLICLVSRRRNCFKQITYINLFTYNMISPCSSHVLSCETHPLYFIRYYGIYFCSRFSNVWATLNISANYDDQKQPPRDVPRKRCSENMQQIYRRTPTPKCDFNKATLLKSHLGIYAVL